MAEEMEERGIPPLRASSGMSKKLRIMLVAFVVLVILVALGLVVYSKLKGSFAADDAAGAGAASAPAGPRSTDLVEPPTFLREARADRDGGDQTAPAPTTPAEQAGTDAASQLAAPPSMAGPSRELTEAEKAAIAHQAKRQRAPVLEYSRSDPLLAGGSNRDPNAAPAAADPYQTAMMAALGAVNGNKSADGEEGSPLSRQLESDSYPVAVATRSTNASFIVPQGTMGRCVLRTAFNSQLAGFSSCILSEPLYSADGRFVMAEAGSEVIGTYQTGLVKPGVARAFVLWNRIRTPHGVVIDLASPATDGLGRSGITGDVNNHFWKRFGSGLLLSMVDDAVAMARGGSYAEFRSTSQSMNDAAAIAVENSADIPPTITVDAGTIVNIFVARDLDFSSVYSARLAAGHNRN